MPITKIVSGGQTGADRGGLEAAIYCELPYGGWIPRGRKAIDGQVPAKYVGMQETSSADYKVRNEANVVDSDATLVFTHGKATGGSKLTMELARKHKKPVLHIPVDQYSRRDVVNFITRWFDGDITIPTPPRKCVLNVAGSRESKAPGIQTAVMAIMVDVISALNGKLFYPLPDKNPPITREGQ